MNPVRLRGDRMNPVRTIERIIKAPDIHWVGNGFRARQYFPDGDESPMLDRMSPFLLLDYNEPYYFEGSPFDTGDTPHPHKGFETVTFSFPDPLGIKMQLVIVVLFTLVMCNG